MLPETLPLALVGCGASHSIVSAQVLLGGGRSVAFGTDKCLAGPA